jgi:hypothetical protein
MVADEKNMHGMQGMLSECCITTHLSKEDTMMMVQLHVFLVTSTRKQFQYEDMRFDG